MAFPKGPSVRAAIIGLSEAALLACDTCKQPALLNSRCCCTDLHMPVMQHAVAALAKHAYNPEYIKYRKDLRSPRMNVLAYEHHAATHHMHCAHLLWSKTFSVNQAEQEVVLLGKLADIFN